MWRSRKVQFVKPIDDDEMKNQEEKDDEDEDINKEVWFNQLYSTVTINGLFYVYLD